MNAHHFTWMIISVSEVLVFGLIGHFSIVNGVTADVVNKATKSQVSDTYPGDIGEIGLERISNVFNLLLTLNAHKTTKKENNVNISIEKIRNYLIQKVSETLQFETKGRRNILNLDFEALQPYFVNQIHMLDQLKKELQGMLKSNMQKCNGLSRENVTIWVTDFLLNSTSKYSHNFYLNISCSNMLFHIVMHL